MFDLTLRAVDPRDSNDFLEADVRLPIVPRVGDFIETWDADAFGGRPFFLEVLGVTLCSYVPEVIRVDVKLDTYGKNELFRCFESITKGEQP